MKTRQNSGKLPNRILLPVLDHPSQKNAKRHITDEIKSLIRPTYDSILYFCFKTKLLVETAYLGEFGFDNFCADFGGHRKVILDLMLDKDQKSNNLRSASFTHLKRAVTSGPKSGLRHKNLAFSLSSFLLKDLENFDKEENNVTKTSLFKSKLDDKKLKKITQTLIFDIESWQRSETEARYVTFWDLGERHQRIEEDGRKITISKKIASLGGEPYRAIEWMSENKNLDFNKAVKISIQKSAEEFKKANPDADFNELVRVLSKSYSKIPQSEIIAMLLDKKDSFDLSEIKKTLNRKQAHRKGVSLWNKETLEREDFPSKEVLAEKFSVSKNTISQTIYSGSVFAGKYYITSLGDSPEAINERLNYRIRMESLMYAIDDILEVSLSKRDKKVITHYIKYMDLDKTAKTFNLTKKDVSWIYETAITSIKLTSLRLKDGENHETRNVGPISGDIISRTTELSHTADDRTIREELAELIQRAGKSNLNEFVETLGGDFSGESTKVSKLFKK